MHPPHGPPKPVPYHQGYIWKQESSGPHQLFFQHLPVGAKNPIWPPSTWYGQTNFFPMGDNFKILFSIIGFWGPGNEMKLFKKLYMRYFRGFQQFLRFSWFLKHFWRFCALASKILILVHLCKYKKLGDLETNNFCILTIWVGPIFWPTGTKIGPRLGQWMANLEVLLLWHLR